MNNNQSLSEEYKNLERKETYGCLTGIIGIIAFIIGMIAVYNVNEEGNLLSKTAAYFVVCGIIMFCIGIYRYNKINKLKNGIGLSIEKNNDDKLVDEYNNKKRVQNIPFNAPVVRYKNGYADILRTNQYLWIDNDKICLFPSDSKVHYEVDKVISYRIPLDKIEYFATRGEIVHENRITGGGGGGSSLGGAVVGGVIAGGAGAVIGSRKKVEPIKSQLITHDQRETFLNFFDESNVRHSLFFDYKDYNVFNDLIPEKAFDIVNAIKTNNVLNKAINESKEKTITNQLRELAKLKDEGILTEEEFVSKKKELLAKIK